MVDGGARRALLSIDCGQWGGGGGGEWAGFGVGGVGGGGGSTHFAVQRVRRKRQKLKPKTTTKSICKSIQNFKIRV